MDQNAPTDAASHGAERWLPVVGFEGLYSVSDRGRVRSEARIVVKTNGVRQPWPEHMLKPHADPIGRLTVRLGGGQPTTRVHRIVLEAFVGPPPAGLECCHNNGNASDNRLANLRYDTHAENNRDRIYHGTSNRGERHGMAKLTDIAVLEIAKSTTSQRVTAQLHGVHQVTVSEIRLGKIWGWLTGIVYAPQQTKETKC